MIAKPLSKLALHAALREPPILQCTQWLQKGKSAYSSIEAQLNPRKMALYRAQLSAGIHTIARHTIVQDSA